MDFLKSIVPVIDRPAFISEVGDSHQLVKLFDSIYKGPNLEEWEIQRLVYRNQGNQVAFKKLKQRLRERITDHVVRNGIAQRRLDNYAVVYCKSLQQLFAVKTLILSNARRAAVILAEKILKTTKKYEFTDITLQLAIELHFHYSGIDNNAVKRRRYSNLMKSTMALYEKEFKAIEYYADLLSEFSSARAALKEKSLNKADRYCLELRGFISKGAQSYQLLLWSYLVLAMRAEILKDHHALLKLCDEAISVFRNRIVSRPVAFYLFDIRRIECYIHFKEFDRVETVASTYFPQMTQGHINWFVLKSYVLLARLHSAKYDKACETMTEVSSVKAYNDIPQTLKQSWLVYEAHIRFLIAIGRVEGHETRASKFRVYRFLNDIPIFSKDKRGLNVAILIVHVLFLLQQRKYSDIIDRVDALNQYCHRYLRRDETFRSNCFVKILLKIAHADFNRLRAERYCKPLLERLRESTNKYSDPAYEIEIIPYEELYEMVINLLD